MFLLLEKRNLHLHSWNPTLCLFHFFKEFFKIYFLSIDCFISYFKFWANPVEYGLLFPVQGSNSHPWHCKAGGLLGKSPPFSRFNRDICRLLRCSLIGWLKAYDFGSRLPEWKPCCIFTGCVSLSKWIKLCSAYLPVKWEKQWCPTHRTDCEDYMCHSEENTATPGRGEHTLRLASTAATDRKFPEGQGFSVSV